MARIADPQLADRRRRQILDAGVTCFRRRGFHQTTLQEICAEAGISAGALYRYFAGKTDLIAAIAEVLHAENDNALLRASEEVGFMPALEALAADAYLRFSEGEAAQFADVLAESMRDEAIAASLRPIVLRGADTFAEAPALRFSCTTLFLTSMGGARSKGIPTLHTAYRSNSSGSRWNTSIPMDTRRYTLIRCWTIGS